MYHVEETDDAVLNTTFVLNVCGTLRSASSRGELDCGKGKNGMFNNLIYYSCSILFYFILGWAFDDGYLLI